MNIEDTIAIDKEYSKALLKNAKNKAKIPFVFTKDGQKIPIPSKPSKASIEEAKGILSGRTEESKAGGGKVVYRKHNGKVGKVMSGNDLVASCYD
tara:strand:+ start:39 stop:323 length:285 start_codon:yes stop_codon:yes gene_type:complete